MLQARKLRVEGRPVSLKGSANSIGRVNPRGVRMKKQEWTIRRATEEDLGTITELWWKSAQYHTSIDSRFEYASDTRSHTEKYHAGLLEKDNVRIFVAEGEEIVGHIVAYIIQSPPIRAYPQSGLIDGFFVDYPFQRQGIGTLLWLEATKWFREHNISKVHLTVAVKNSTAIAFWKHVGFEDIMIRYELALE